MVFRSKIPLVSRQVLGVVDMPVIPKPRRQRQNLRAQGRSGLPSDLSIDSESTSENPEEKKKLNYFILIKHENLKESIASYIAEMLFVPQFRSSYNGVIRCFPSWGTSLHVCTPVCHTMNCWNLKQEVVVGGIRLFIGKYADPLRFFEDWSLVLCRPGWYQIYSIATATFLASTNLLGLQVCAGIPGMASL